MCWKLLSRLLGRQPVIAMPHVPQLISRRCPVCETPFTFLWPIQTYGLLSLLRPSQNVRCPRCHSLARAYESGGDVELKKSKSNHRDLAIKCPNCSSPWEGWRTPEDSLAKINGAIRIKKNLYECPECHTQATVK